MKVKVSFDGRNNNETWEVVEADVLQGCIHQKVSVHTGVTRKRLSAAGLTITKAGTRLHIRFESEKEMERYGRGIALCRANYTSMDGEKEIYLTAVSYKS